MKQKVLTISGLISDVDKELDKLVENGFGLSGDVDDMDTEYYELSGEFLSDTAVYIQKLMESE